MSSRHRDHKLTTLCQSDVPRAGKLLFSRREFTTQGVVAANTPKTSDVPHCAPAKVDLPDQVILDVTHHQTMLSFLIDEMTKSLGKGKLRLVEAAFTISILSIAYLLEEAIGAGIHNN